MPLTASSAGCTAGSTTSPSFGDPNLSIQRTRKGLGHSRGKRAVASAELIARPIDVDSLNGFHPLAFKALGSVPVPSILACDLRLTYAGHARQLPKFPP
jgi:hypothetical protein